MAEPLQSLFEQEASLVAFFRELGITDSFIVGSGVGGEADWGYVEFEKLDEVIRNHAEHSPDYSWPLQRWEKGQDVKYATTATADGRVYTFISAKPEADTFLVHTIVCEEIEGRHVAWEMDLTIAQLSRLFRRVDTRFPSST